MYFGNYIYQIQTAVHWQSGGSLPSEWKFQGATMSSMKPKKTTSVMTKPESEPELSPSQPEKTTMKSNLRKPSPPPHPRIQLLHQLHRQVDLLHQGTANTK